MNIKRQYNLPNCTLTLDGMDPSNFSLNNKNGKLSSLGEAEFRFTGKSETLKSDKTLLENLVKVISSYAQSVLSGVSAPILLDLSNQVKLERISQNLHRLIVYTNTDQGLTDSNKKMQQFDLTTVQLFDLVEALDQLMEDTFTLPDLSLQLKPVPKRYAKAGEPLTKRALPGIVGVSGVAIAAMAFLSAPVPEVKRPKEANPDPVIVTASPTPASSNSPNNSPNVSPSPVATNAPTTPSPITSPTATPDIQSLTNTATPITDPQTIKNLQKQLYDQINQAWKSEKFPQELVYRVSVGKDGAIIGYKPENDRARELVAKTPLPNLLYKPVGNRVNESLADFRVVFTANGALEVSPY